MNDRQSSAARFATIDVLRGAAALFVACLHIRETAWIGMRDFWHLHPSWSSPDTWIALLSAPVMFGSFGVSAFFVISGYCIHRAHASRLSRDATYRVDGGRFWFRRLVRIYPVLLAALLLTLLCDTLSERLVPGFYKLGELGPGTFALNLLAMEGLFAHPFGSNGPLWTLAIEIQLYVVYPLVFLVRRRFGISWTLGAALALSALSWFVFERRGLSLFASYQFSWVLGAYVADRETMARPPVSGQGAAPGLSRVVGVGGVLLVGIGCTVFMVSQYLAFQIWALGFAMALAWLLEHPLRIGPIAGAFRQVGHFSYSLYAIHLPLAVLAVCLVFDGRKQVSALPALLIVCLTIACAYVFHLAFERPFVAWLARRPESKGLRSVEPVAKNVN